MSHSSSPSGRRGNRRPSGGRFLLAGLVLATAIGGGVAWSATLRGDSPASSSPTAIASTALPTPAPTTPPPLTPAQQLLATSSDPSACAVSFVGDGISLPPILETTNQRFLHLPIPRAEGLVFAGWYSTEAAASARDVAQRVNGAAVVACDESREATVYAS